jgi:hypothetical protein
MVKMSNNDKIRNLLSQLHSPNPLKETDFEDSVDMLAQYLLFGTKWETVITNDPKARRKVPILGDVPLVCKAEDCPYAQKCPVLREIKVSADRLKLVGTECRADKIYAIEEFAAFVQDLQIDPEQTTDIINVASLIRLLILKRRIDWTLAIEGIMDKEPGVIDQRTGQVYFKRVVHPLLKVSESLEKQIAALQKQLMADRQARAALAASLGKGSDILKDLFSNSKILEADNPIDAEFHINSEEVEE